MPFEIKNIDEEKGTFVAYGSTFGNKDHGGDIVVKGAFAKSLEEIPVDSVYMFYNHDTKEIIGEWIDIKEDDKGLLVKGRLFINQIQRAKETYFLMLKKKINKFSIGYSTIKKSFKNGARMLHELKLIEVSPVTFPMNDSAELLGVKNMNIDDIENLNSIKDIEGALRESGFSQKAAETMISKVAKFKRISSEGEPCLDDEGKQSDPVDAVKEELKEAQEQEFKNTLDELIKLLDDVK